MLNLGYKVSREDPRDRVYYPHIHGEVPAAHYCGFTKVYNIYEDGETKPLSVGYAIASHLSERSFKSDLLGPEFYGISDFGVEETLSSDGIELRQALKNLCDFGLKDLNGNTWKVQAYGRVNPVYLRQALIRYGPVIVGLPVYNDKITDFWTPQGVFEPIGYNCVTVNGYTNTTYILKNCWGITYGSFGQANLPEEELIEYSTECWVLINDN
jgi:hypothetical protein